MPNPKTGTVTTDIAKAVREIKAGKVEFRVDKTGIVHAPIGKVSFESSNLLANAQALVDSVVQGEAAGGEGQVSEDADGLLDDGTRHPGRRDIEAMAPSLSGRPTRARPRGRSSSSRRH